MKQNDLPLYGTTLAAAAAVCLFANALNALFYALWAPFYDSMAYLNHLALIMNETRVYGMAKALSSAFNGTTVALPWIQGILYSFFFEPSRSLSILIQAPWVATLVLSSAFYFRIYAGYSRFLSAAFSILMISFPAVYEFNGGLSDLRVDLLQALTFGSALAVYLTARTTERISYWVTFGFLLAAACLSRATTPVYIIFIFGPLLVFDLTKGRPLQTIKYYSAAAIVVIICALWFFVINFDHLRYYYLVWNTDAIARLPLEQSSQHIGFLFKKHIGLPITIFLIATLTGRLLIAKKNNNISLSKDLNWPALWAGIMPVFYLVASGAGLNPFVSLISVPGVLLFFLAPLSSSPSSSPISTVFLGRYQTFAGATAVALALLAAARGVPNHTTKVSSWISSNSGIAELTNRMLQYPAPGRHDFSYQVMYVGAVASPTLLNVLAFDRKYYFVNDSCVTNGNRSYYSLNGTYSQPAEWRATPGVTVEEKVASIVASSIKYADFLIVPEPDSVLAPHVPINPFAADVRRHLLDAKLTKIGEPIRLSGTEAVTLYWNRDRINIEKLCVT